MIIAIDPGSVRTGVAMFTYDEKKQLADLVVMKVIDRDGLNELIRKISNPGSVKHTIVLEDFKHAMATGNFRGRKTAQMARDEIETHKIAKAIKVAAAVGENELVIQEPRILAMGRKWSDIKVPKTGHIDDDKSAYIHGAYYLMESGKIRTVDQITKFGQPKLEDA